MTPIVAPDTGAAYDGALPVLATPWSLSARAGLPGSLSSEGGGHIRASTGNIERSFAGTFRLSARDRVCRTRPRCVARRRPCPGLHKGSILCCRFWRHRRGGGAAAARGGQSADTTSSRPRRSYAGMARRSPARDEYEMRCRLNSERRETFPARFHSRARAAGERQAMGGGGVTFALPPPLSDVAASRLKSASNRRWLRCLPGEGSGLLVADEDPSLFLGCAVDECLRGCS
jgi:hypothetical protein